ncbi:hypothetical protein BK004_04075 [bacterium CG10_46_32]|nr:MAG: hypothetical protein BK004_04075 [bacterium CG10_46_32]PIR55796.1 MAG: hypothetical protein COU73_04115 [Parcubacteria group bacterium CG10_big_fil_rev_8_21_14_0_10_46_32]
MKDTRNILYVARSFLWGGSVLFLAWLFFQNLVPTGEFVLQYKKGSAISPITDLHPEQRVIDLDDDGPNSQRFYVDPVYFDAKVPREFDTVTVDITFQNQAQPILELGARRLRGSWGFVMKPLQNTIIDNLDWPCQRYDGVLFCQKQERYTNLSALLVKPPSEPILTYHYALPENIQWDVMNVNTDTSEYNYLVATYTPPESLGDDWYRTSVPFVWSDFELYINEISFLVSAPELNKGHGDIVLKDITILLKRDPLDWNGFVEYIKNQLKRLKT